MRLSSQAVALAVAIAIGAGVGAAIASTGHVEYEAQSSVLLSAKGGAAVVTPLLPSAREVATSGVLAGDVQSTLRLRGSAENLRGRIHATTPPHTQLIMVSYTNRGSARAQQVAQEVAVKLTQLIPARFRTTAPSLKATIFDQAHIVRRTGPDFVGDSLIGAAIGLVLGLAAVAATSRRAPARPIPAGLDGALAEREAKLEERIAAVTARETALARRAGELAQRERALEEHAAPAAKVEAELPPEPVVVPTAEPASEPVQQAAPVAVTEAPAELTLTALERLVSANAERFPEAADEWNAYLFYLRDYADLSGRLPASFEGLIEDVFAPLFHTSR